VRYLVRFTDSRPEVVRFFRHVKMPDEIYVQTVLLNSPLRETIVADDIHYIDWSRGGSHPKTLGTEDYAKIVASGKLFARKFDPVHDAQILDLLDGAKAAKAMPAV
jgi:core-2/I-Branching enzyme